MISSLCSLLLGQQFEHLYTNPVARASQEEIRAWQREASIEIQKEEKGFKVAHWHFLAMMAGWKRSVGTGTGWDSQPAVSRAHRGEECGGGMLNLE
jgi:hypothetical protein